MNPELSNPPLPQTRQLSPTQKEGKKHVAHTREDTQRGRGAPTNPLARPLFTSDVPPRLMTGQIFICQATASRNHVADICYLFNFRHSDLFSCDLLYGMNWNNQESTHVNRRANRSSSRLMFIATFEAFL